MKEPQRAGPIIVIGAPRSGTNMLRDVLTSLPGCGTWPCDEINFIWRHGNARFPTDELQPLHARPEVIRFVRRQFQKLKKAPAFEVPVEKTCANSLRVGFVDRIFPDARYVFIVRNGLDAVASAVKRWSAPLDLAYTMRKARYVPASDVPLYAVQQLFSRVHRTVSGKKRLATWGPRFEGLTNALESLTIEEVCALQWRRCVESSSSELKAIDQGRVFRVGYEDFTSSPREHLLELCQKFDLDADTARLDSAVANVTTRSIGKGAREMSPEAIERVVSHMQS